MSCFELSHGMIRLGSCNITPSHKEIAIHLDFHCFLFFLAYTNCGNITSKKTLATKNLIAYPKRRIAKHIHSYVLHLRLIWLLCCTLLVGQWTVETNKRRCNHIGCLLVNSVCFECLYNSMYRKKNSVLLEVDRSIIENNLLIQVKSIPVNTGIIRVWWTVQDYQHYRLVLVLSVDYTNTDCMPLTFISMRQTLNQKERSTQIHLGVFIFRRYLSFSAQRTKVQYENAENIYNS